MNKKFFICADVEKATGTQTWMVEAATPEEAIEIVKKGGGEFYEEEVEVTALGNYYHAGEVSDD